MRRFHSYTVESYLNYLKRLKITRKITDIHLHHTWKPTKKSYIVAKDKEKVIYGMWRYHTQTLKWRDIGQHISISPDGLIWDGRDVNTIPASISGHNEDAFAIEIIGNFDKGYEKLEGIQLKTVQKLVKGLFDIFKTKNLIFHRDYSTKTCPGTSLTKDMFFEQDKENTTILGKAVATKEQMKQYLLSINPNPKISCTADELVSFYIQEGQIEGVRGDIAFSQALLETGFFRYGGIVQSHQNNYAGLGATNSTQTGKAATFSTPKYGVKAHIQHLKGYASKNSVKQPIVDPRYSILATSKLLGSCKYVTDLNGKWAVPGDGYGEKILKVLKKILAIQVEKEVEVILTPKKKVSNNQEDENLKVKQVNQKLIEEIAKLKKENEEYRQLLFRVKSQIDKHLKTDF